MKRDSNLTFREQIRGFPVQQMLIICVIRISEPLAFTSLFPYLYFMIRDFKIAPEEKDISKYSGYLASSFAFCQFLFCVKWGKMSDKIGRKYILLLGLCGTATSLTIFGFSKNYYMALFGRSLAGVLNGNVAVLRTMIGEIATERKHQGIAFSTLPLLYNLGSVIGPLIGGSKYLTRPKKDNVYNPDPSALVETLTHGDSVYERFITKYPYALSNIVVASIIMCSMVFGLLFLEETHETVKYKRDRGLEFGDWILSKLGFQTKTRPWQIAQEEVSEVTPLISDNQSSSENSDEDRLKGVNEANNTKDKYSNAFTPRVISAISSNFLISLHNVTFSEFLPVFLASRFKPDKLKFPFRIEGGLGLDASYIGDLISSTGIMGMLIILVIFPYFDRKFGTIQGFRISVSIFPVVYFLVPFAVFTLHDYNPSIPKWVTPISLYFLTSLRVLASGTGMPQIMLLNHRAAAKEHRAYVNSSSMSFIALARCVGPVFFGYLMSVGDKLSWGWLTWWVMSLLALVGTIKAFFMKDYDDEGVAITENDDDENDEAEDDDSDA